MKKIWDDGHFEVEIDETFYFEGVKLRCEATNGRCGNCYFHTLENPTAACDPFACHGFLRTDKKDVKFVRV